ncbi:MAG: type III secretion system cytoplasmic ring protein SctQ [Chlamydiales bacterium]|nr:type III secretion system cytoplasmic ring protein SctQ [Chlamydiales bacterium]
MTTALHQWWTLKKISPEIQELNQVPLLGSAPPFDWQKFSSLLTESLGAQPLSIYPTNPGWRTKEELTLGLGQDLVVLSVDLTPLGASAYWLMSRQDISKLTSLLFSKESNDSLLSSDLLQEGFYRYVLLQILDAATSIDPLQTFTPILHEEAPLPEDKAFCMDLVLQCGAQACSGRLLIPNELRLHWMRHFNQQNLSSISPRLLRTIELTLGIKTGSVLLRHEQWSKLKKGDVLLLDQGSYDPRHGEGIVSLTLGATPLFHLNIQKNSIHLLNYAFIYEDATDMSTHDEPPEDLPTEDEITLQDETPEEEAESVGIKETPVYITVELARVRMPLEKLMQLEPGNLLELPIDPDQDVTLSVGGQKVGKAELVYLGERLGVRIMQLG